MDKLLDRINKRLLDQEFDGVVELLAQDAIDVDGVFSLEDLKRVVELIEEELKYDHLNS